MLSNTNSKFHNPYKYLAADKVIVLFKGRYFQAVYSQKEWILSPAVPSLAEVANLATSLPWCQYTKHITLWKVLSKMQVTTFFLTRNNYNWCLPCYLPFLASHTACSWQYHGWLITHTHNCSHTCLHLQWSWTLQQLITFSMLSVWSVSLYKHDLLQWVTSVEVTSETAATECWVSGQ